MNDPRVRDAIRRTPEVLEAHRQLLEELKAHVLELKEELRKVKAATVRAKKG